MSKDTGGPGPLDLLYAQHDRPLEDSKAVLEKSVRRKKQAMSRAVELAEKAGCTVWRTEFGAAKVEFRFPELEAFYHAARAEALREADELVGTSVTNGWPCAEELAAKADREEK